MGNRSYEQVCPAAYALDIVGERWTLLIIRELAHGSRRFTDLQHSLPGIGPNLLSDRLKKLEQFDVIRQRRLPPPAASTVYELTETGALLRPVLVGLTQFGLRYMPLPPPSTDVVTPNSLVGILWLRFRRETAVSSPLRAELHANGDVVYAVIEDGTIRSGYGTIDDCHLIVTGEPPALFNLILHEQKMDDLLDREQIRLVKGDSALLQLFLDHFAPLT